MTETKKKDKKGRKKGNKKGQKEKEGDPSAGKEKFARLTVLFVCPVPSCEIPESDIQLKLVFQDDSVNCPPYLYKLAAQLSHG